MEAETKTVNIPLEIGKPTTVVLNFQFVSPIEPTPDVGMKSMETAKETISPEPTEPKTPVGNIGERKVFHLQALRHRVVREETSVSYLYEFRDADDRRFTWRTYRNKGMINGEWYDVRATINKLFVRKGVEVVGITRGRMV